MPLWNRTSDQCAGRVTGAPPEGGNAADNVTQCFQGDEECFQGDEECFQGDEEGFPGKDEPFTGVDE